MMRPRAAGCQGSPRQPWSRCSHPAWAAAACRTPSAPVSFRPSPRPCRAWPG